MIRIFALIICLFLSVSSNAQELNCQVSVLAPGIQLSDKRVFTTLETTIREFMSNKKWTSDQFLRDEKIECNLTFNITKYSQSEQSFEGTLQIQSRRPVFNSNYGSILLNFIDKDISFRYLEYQPIEFADNAYISGLASLLGYYAYVIIAMDYDSFSLEGGGPYWQKAQQVVQNAITDPAKGWKGTDIPPRNRFWLVENYLNPIYKPLREANYLFHRKGMDNMYDKMELGRTSIIESLQKIQIVNKQRPSSYNVQLWFNAKADELINIFKQSSPAEKVAVMQLLGELDATNNNKYKQINQ
ncbi:MAG: DUF4835 family protein [Bacteroidia bacterium]